MNNTNSNSNFETTYYIGVFCNDCDYTIIVSIEYPQTLENALDKLVYFAELSILRNNPFVLLTYQYEKQKYDNLEFSFTTGSINASTEYNILISKGNNT